MDVRTRLEIKMKRLNKKWIEWYYSVPSRDNGYNPKYKWLGAWRLMRDFQNTDTVERRWP